MSVDRYGITVPQELRAVPAQSLEVCDSNVFSLQHDPHAASSSRFMPVAFCPASQEVFPFRTIACMAPLSYVNRSR